MSTSPEFTSNTAYVVDALLRRPQRTRSEKLWESLTPQENASRIENYLESLANRYLMPYRSHQSTKIDDLTTLTVRDDSMILDTTDTAVILRPGVVRARWIRYKTPRNNAHGFAHGLTTRNRIELGYYADKIHETQMSQQGQKTIPRTIILTDESGRAEKYAVSSQQDTWKTDDSQCYFASSPVYKPDLIAGLNAVLAFEAKLFDYSMIRDKTDF
jgi:hypothetical protein